MRAPLPLAARADVRGPNEGMPRGEKDVNKLLVSQGFPELKAPKGLSPYVGYIGTAPPANIDGSKSKERAFSSPLLVRFAYPSSWLPEIPSITENGEAGNVGANNYIKGDSANFASLSIAKGDKIASIGKETYKNMLSAQMSNDVYEDVKVKKVKQVTQPDGTDMAIFDFTYTLLTRAGFTVIRKGVASAMIVNDDSLVGIVAATTELRFKELEESLRACADSFRAYPVKSPGFNLKELGA